LRSIDLNASKNGYTPDGALRPEFARRLEWLVREANKRGMVVMVGLFSPRKDQELKGEKAVRRACEETARLLSERKLQNVFVDLMHEYNHKRCDLDIFKEPDGATKKASLTAWSGGKRQHLRDGHPARNRPPAAARGEDRRR
jgi:hypothetical protein